MKKHGKRWRELARSAGDEGDQTTKTLDTGMGHGRPQEAEAGESTRMDRSGNSNICQVWDKTPAVNKAKLASSYYNSVAFAPAH